MRRVILTLLCFLALTSSVSAANRYWVGGTDNWDGTAGSKWALTSGAAGGQAVPTASDDCFFDAASGAVTVTVLTVTATCKSLDFTGFTGTWAGSVATTITGSLTLATGMTRTYTGVLTLNSTLAGQTIDLKGKTLASTGITIGAAGGVYTLNSNFNNGTAGNVLFNNGTFNTNGFQLNALVFQAGSGLNNLTFIGATSTIVAQSFSTSGTFTSFSAASTTINLTDNVQQSSFSGNGQTYGTTTMTSSGGTNNITGANTFYDLTLTNSAANVTFPLAANQTVQHNFTVAGQSAISRPLISSSVKGAQRTITSANNVISNADFQDILGAGAASWNLSAITGNSGDCGGNSSITFTTATTTYWIGDGGNWNATAEWANASGGVASSSRVPLCQDSSIFDNGSFSGVSQVVTQNMVRIGAVSWSGYNEGQTPTWTTSTAASVFGSLTLISDMTLTNSSLAYVFEGRGTHTITMAGKTWAKNITFNGFGGTYTLQDNFLTTLVLTHSSGTLTANNVNVTMASFSSAGTVTRTLNMGSGTWMTTSNTGTTNLWQTTSTGITLNAQTSTVRMVAGLNAIAHVFQSSGLTWNIVWIDRGVATTTFSIQGAGTYDTLRYNDGLAAHQLIFPPSVTSTFTNFLVSGSQGNPMTVNVGGNTAVTTFAKAGTGVVTARFLAVASTTVSGANTWYASESTNTAGNTGWTFRAPPSTTSTYGGTVRILGGRVFIKKN